MPDIETTEQTDKALKPTTTDKMDLTTAASAVAGGGIQLLPSGLQEAVSFGQLMAKAGPMVPKHCRDNPAVCLAIAMQAWRWGFDPFIVAQKSYQVSDNVVAYEAQLIAAVIHSRADLACPPEIEFEGEGANLRCTVTLTFNDGSIRDYRSPEFGKITTKNSPLWKYDPEQQLGYYSIRAAARRHCPGVILGAYDRDEAMTIDHEPETPKVGAHLAKTEDQSNGFSGADLEGEVDKIKPQDEAGIFPGDREFDPDIDEVYDGKGEEIGL